MLDLKQYIECEGGGGAMPSNTLGAGNPAVLDGNYLSEPVGGIQRPTAKAKKEKFSTSINKKKKHNMKNLNDYLSESLVNENKLDTIKTKIKAEFKRLFSKGVREWNKETEWLNSFTTSNDVKEYIKKHFDINDQENTAYELEEYGGLVDLESFVETRFLPLSDVNKIISYIKNGSNDWRVSSVDEDFVWFLPALKAWSIKFEDLDERACIDSCKNFR